MYACMYACMHVCMYACMYVCMYVCMYAFTYLCLCVYCTVATHAHAHIQHAAVDVAKAANSLVMFLRLLLSVMVVHCSALHSEDLR